MKRMNVKGTCAECGQIQALVPVKQIGLQKRLERFYFFFNCPRCSQVIESEIRRGMAEVLQFQGITLEEVPDELFDGLRSRPLLTADEKLELWNNWQSHCEWAEWQEGLVS